MLPEEVMLHNKCRGLLLNPRHPFVNLTRGIQGGVASSSLAPWCYYRKKIGKKSELKLDRCFDICLGEPREEKTEPGQVVYYTISTSAENYNLG
ncbi:hypothetical protein GCK32_022113 [Trichostrongylus colubriformis]|uniref:Kringle-like domain-containing protein n=1 Tax=Trichostrongylus colubriformis TaxID=6319 RepID=A0AAN8FK96_TRICO